ncbi:hypothetical protein tb265_46240 [Gemmatimonadetes bacterium T265]|nr:hypothetical protein tb265_46240 [Gemmatimonadetes bacterium T265]
MTVRPHATVSVHCATVSAQRGRRARRLDLARGVRQDRGHPVGAGERRVRAVGQVLLPREEEQRA